MRRKILRAGLGLAILLSGGVSAQAQNLAAGELRKIREMIVRLDSNLDTVIEADEVPDQGRAAFDRLVKLGDANKNGKLEGDELRAMGLKLRALAPDPMPRFKAMDLDGDDKLSSEEFRGAKLLFDRLDADGDGFLTRREFAKGTVAPGGKAMIERLLAMDRDGDGKVSRDEFPGRPVLFNRLDANKDGFLSSEEIREGLARTAQAGTKAP